MAERFTRESFSGESGRRRRHVLLLTVMMALTILGSARSAHAAAPAVGPIDTIPVPSPVIPPVPVPPTDATGPTSPSDARPDVVVKPSTSSQGSTNDQVSVTLPDLTKPTPNSVLIILLVTVISLVPTLLILTTAFTRIVIVLSLTRNAVGIPQLPPQQVIVGLSFFLTLFVMAPTFTKINHDALQPLLANKITTSQAYEAAQGPMREFMLGHTGDKELKLFLDASRTKTPTQRAKVPLSALIPAFILSELKTGFIIGFCIFIPFLIIDLVVSSVLMGLGMMMLPPSFVSLPFKLLLFVMIDGWALVVGTLLHSYR